MSGQTIAVVGKLYTCEDENHELWCDVVPADGPSLAEIMRTIDNRNVAPPVVAIIVPSEEEEQ